MSKLFKGLSVLAVLVSGAAFAGPIPARCNTGNDAYHPASTVDTYGSSYGYTTVPVIAPPPPAGHYEVRQVNTFIPGHWSWMQRGHHMRRVFIAGHYELVAQRVWVNAPRYTGPEYSYGVQVAPPPPAGVTFGVSFSG